MKKLAFAATRGFGRRRCHHRFRRLRRSLDLGNGLGLLRRRDLCLEVPHGTGLWLFGSNRAHDNGPGHRLLGRNRQARHRDRALDNLHTCLFRTERRRQKSSNSPRFSPTAVSKPGGSRPISPKSHPELTTIEGVLANPDLVGGRFHDCPAGWGCDVTNLNNLKAAEFEASGLERFQHGSGETLATSIAAAYEAKEPLVRLLLGPHQRPRQLSRW